MKFAGTKATLEQYESLYVFVLAKMEKELLYLEERTQRMRLIHELEHFLEKIKGFVMP